MVNHTSFPTVIGLVRQLARWLSNITRTVSAQFQPSLHSSVLTSSVFGLDVQTGRPAVNVGSSADPVWYAQEALRIVPYQMYTRPVPDHLTGAMVDQAAYHPRQSQWLIEHEGLSQLGFNVIQDNAVQMVSQMDQFYVEVELT
jgi:hypothetical protein